MDTAATTPTALSLEDATAARDAQTDLTDELYLSMCERANQATIEACKAKLASLPSDVILVAFRDALVKFLRDRHSKRPRCIMVMVCRPVLVMTLAVSLHTFFVGDSIVERFVKDMLSGLGDMLPRLELPRVVAGMPASDLGGILHLCPPRIREAAAALAEECATYYESEPEDDDSESEDDDGLVSVYDIIHMRQRMKRSNAAGRDARDKKRGKKRGKKRPRKS